MRYSLLWAAVTVAVAAPNPSILISGEWLSAHLRDDSLVVLHVGTQRDYDAGHIPGSRLVTLNDISITDASGLRLELPGTDKLEEAFAKLGVTDSSRVIVYAGTPSVQSATRVWFTLDYLGAGNRAALLDGGLAAWKAAGRPVATDTPPPARAGKFTAHPRPELVVNADWVREHLADKNVQLVDARDPQFYSGADAGSMPRGGHIPGARNVPYSSLLGENGAIHGSETLHSPAALTVSYCHIGQQATVIYFAARYQGLEARLYDGSFQDWSRRAELPVELGVAGKIEALFAPLADAKSPGLAVLVRAHGQTVFERGYGVRDLRSLAKIDEHTNFRLASFTKQFTSMAIMLLVHDRKLTYETTVGQIFPEFPAWGRGITVRQLLHHESGLPDYGETMGEGWSSTHQINDQEVLQVLEKQPAAKFEPGSKYEYSNSGYVLLGLIVAKVSGKSYPQFLHDRIFGPLHMDDTIVFVNGMNQVSNRAYGHNKEGDKLIEGDQNPTSATLGDGGIYSNLTDLAKWDDALEHHTLLGEREMSEALRPGMHKPYGFGWFLDPYEGRSRMYHTGSTSGFRTVIERFSDGLTVIILANRTDVDPEKLARATMSICSEQH